MLTFLRAELLGNQVIIYSDLVNIAKELSKEAMTIFIPTTTGLEFRLLHILANAW